MSWEYTSGDTNVICKLLKTKNIYIYKLYLHITTFKLLLACKARATTWQRLYKLKFVSSARIMDVPYELIARRQLQIFLR